LKLFLFQTLVLFSFKSAVVVFLKASSGSPGRRKRGLPRKWKVHAGYSVFLDPVRVLKYFLLLFCLFCYLLNGENAGKKCWDPEEAPSGAALPDDESPIPTHHVTFPPFGSTSDHP
jgi:hypothetical protein